MGRYLAGPFSNLPWWTLAVAWAVALAPLFALLERMRGLSCEHIVHVIAYPPTWILGLVGGLLIAWICGYVVTDAMRVEPAIAIAAGLAVLGAVILCLGYLWVTRDSSRSRHHNLPDDWPDVDAPIHNPEHDQFDAQIMARRMARILTDKRLPSIGLIGPFGSGKTSVLNLVKHYLEHRPQLSRESRDQDGVSSPAMNERPRVWTCAVDSWGLVDGKAVLEIVLERVVDKLSRHVDCLGLVHVPQGYNRRDRGRAGHRQRRAGGPAWISRIARRRIKAIGECAGRHRWAHYSLP
jgi:hypothetical protein